MSSEFNLQKRDLKRKNKAAKKIKKENEEIYRSCMGAICWGEIKNFTKYDLYQFNNDQILKMCEYASNKELDISTFDFVDRKRISNINNIAYIIQNHMYISKIDFPKNIYNKYF
uniref:Uncharacterized protein n=1 Tax=viral metagenome TaxID=1070528 RepID=A0A6C0AFB1_9ZZZZ